MRQSARILQVLLGLSVMIGFAVGCGARSEKSAKDKMLDEVPDNYDLVADLTGVNDATPVDAKKPAEEKPSAPAQEAPVELEGEPIGGSQGVFVAKIILEGQPANGFYDVKSIEGDVIKKHVAVGKEIRLNPGAYDMIFTAEKVVGKPTFDLTNVQISAGRRITREVKVPVGQIRLTTGDHCAKKQIYIKPKGADDWYEGKFYTCEDLTLMAGEYEALMGAPGKGGTPISGIQVYDGGKRDVLIRAQ